MGGGGVSHDLDLDVVARFDWLCFDNIRVVFDDADGFCVALTTPVHGLEFGSRFGGSGTVGWMGDLIWVGKVGVKAEFK